MVSALFFWSGRRESNPRESAWEADAIPLGDSRNRKLPYYYTTAAPKKQAFLSIPAHIYLSVCLRSAVQSIPASFLMTYPAIISPTTEGTNDTDDGTGLSPGAVGGVLGGSSLHSTSSEDTPLFFSAERTAASCTRTSEQSLPSSTILRTDSRWPMARERRFSTAFVCVC